MVTPTTKAADHDVPISPEEIVRQGLVTQDDWDTVSTRAPPPFASFTYHILVSEQHSCSERQEEQFSTAELSPCWQGACPMVFHCLVR